ncbi:hypothetical protein HMPREF1981_02516 [Bacteroides pyogenes F0041]|uniref:Uncharacterized protein n=1 Tax=Bacteroides pyogenes F0041 TaxID=1321819 RepID=U2CJ36_9BACE|nr:hypothetical protein HMPREF1981_02516 [Bacteroides pyogenes F0041]
MDSIPTGKVQPPKTAFFVFTLLLSLHILHLCPCIMSGIGCSLSAAKVVPGFYGQKKIGSASRLDDNLHTSISLQVVFSP